MYERARHAFKRAPRAAGLLRHFTPHCLRHSYATLLLIDGVTPVYAQQQLGHASISITVGRYGKWIRVPNKGMVDRLDEPGHVLPSSGTATRTAGALAEVRRLDQSGSKAVATRAAGQAEG